MKESVRMNGFGSLAFGLWAYECCDSSKTACDSHLTYLRQCFCPPATIILVSATMPFCPTDRNQAETPPQFGSTTTTATIFLRAQPKPPRSSNPPFPRPPTSSADSAATLRRRGGHLLAAADFCQNRERRLRAYRNTGKFFLPEPTGFQHAYPTTPLLRRTRCRRTRQNRPRRRSQSLRHNAWAFAPTSTALALFVTIAKQL